MRRTQRIVVVVDALHLELVVRDARLGDWVLVLVSLELVGAVVNFEPDRNADYQPQLIVVVKLELID